MALVVLEIVVREEDLRDVEAELGEEVFVSRHQPRLADGGAGLQLGEFLGPRLEAEHAHARTDRSGGDEDDLAARPALGGDLRDKLLHLRKVRLLPGVCEDAGAELDDEACDVFENRRTHGEFVTEGQGRTKRKVRS